MNYSKTSNGITYTEEIFGNKGAAFILFPDAEHTTEMIKAAVSELFGEREVVSLKVADERDRDELYRSEIFAHPATKHLKWYEINADNYEIIREERERGTTVAEFISFLVLPFVTETLQKNLDRFGDKILDD